MILAEISHTAAQSGIGLGSAIAAVLSWHRNRSILLMIIHGILSWLYILYFAMSRRPDEQ
jgi:hypothetical protein